VPCMNINIPELAQRTPFVIWHTGCKFAKLIREVQKRDRICFVLPPPRWQQSKTPGQGEAPTPQTVLTVGLKGRFSVMSKSERRNRTATLPPVRCLPEERDEIRQKAEDAGLSIGAFMLRAALGRKIAPQTDHKLINELSRLGGLQKHLFKEGNGVGSKEYAEILQAIKAAIFRIEQKND
ncbi:hypothetical protein AN2345V1_5335, partial (plasmid) [Klebsiella pneumoniae]|jgi:hypothetical protein